MREFLWPLRGRRLQHLLPVLRDRDARGDLRGRAAGPQPQAAAPTPKLTGAGKLDRARARLYRNEILQENMRLKALAEIFTMHSFALL